jgi:hypothetical protein
MLSQSIVDQLIRLVQSDNSETARHGVLALSALAALPCHRCAKWHAHPNFKTRLRAALAAPPDNTNPVAPVSTYDCRLYYPSPTLLLQSNVAKHTPRVIPMPSPPPPRQKQKCRCSSGAGPCSIRNPPNRPIPVLPCHVPALPFPCPAHSPMDEQTGPAGRGLTPVVSTRVDAGPAQDPAPGQVHGEDRDRAGRTGVDAAVELVATTMQEMEIR